MHQSSQFVIGEVFVALHFPLVVVCTLQRLIVRLVVHHLPESISSGKMFHLGVIQSHLIFQEFPVCRVVQCVFFHPISCIFQGISLLVCPHFAGCQMLHLSL